MDRAASAVTQQDNYDITALLRNVHELYLTLHLRGDGTLASASIGKRRPCRVAGHENTIIGRRRYHRDGEPGRSYGPCLGGPGVGIAV